MQFASNVLDPSRAMIRGAPPNLMPSLRVDLRAGNKLELPWLAGRVVQLGAAHGVPTPVNRVVYAALKPYANGTPGPPALRHRSAAQYRDHRADRRRADA
jgi:2-dehydropantoate 2-reductase